MAAQRRRSTAASRQGARSTAGSAPPRTADGRCAESRDASSRVRVRVRLRLRVEVRVGVRVGVRTGIRVGIGVRVRAGARVSDDLPRAIGPIEEGHRAADLRGVLGLAVGLVTPEVEDRNVPVRG